MSNNSTKRFSTTNGKATDLKKDFTAGSLRYILNNAGKLSPKAMANVLHRPVQQVYYNARKLGVSISFGGRK